ncbi:5166_t:CDS:2, partial [Acaulospora morrowiae]
FNLFPSRNMSGMKEATDMSVFIALLMRVARAFFQTQHIVVLDQLTRQESISDENLAKGVGLSVKEIHRLCGTLKEARLIREFARTEPKKAEQRAISRTYYYIDWQQVVNVIKWKIFRIREMVHERMRNELENKGYLCPGCKKTFAPLEIRNLIDMTRGGAFVCDLCHTELIHNDNAENVKGTEKLHGRFMEQSQPLIDLLKAIDKL